MTRSGITRDNGTTELQARPLVTIQQGQIEGLWLDTDTGPLATFRGIPFAAPPIGPLRWAPPEKPSAWEGIRDGSQFGARAMQNPAPSIFTKEMIKRHGWPEEKTQRAIKKFEALPQLPISEDCLFLNVTTPEIAPTEARPVMVWIHGGSHQSGTGSLAAYQSLKLPAEGIVLVTINYRLGVFGYMAHPRLSEADPNGVSGNYGILDQIAALEWVTANISAFGGDPANITIFGQSAGAQAVSELMASPLADGLYQKAILQSGVYSWNPTELKNGFRGHPSGEQMGVNFMRQNNLATSEASIDDLRNIDADDLLHAALTDTEHLGKFLPLADGYVQPARLWNLINDNQLAPVPILLGYNGDEGSLFYEWYNRPTRYDYDFPDAPDARLAHFKQVFGPDADSLIADYGFDQFSARQQTETDMLGDDSYGVHTRLLADSHANRKLPVWIYHFRRSPSSPEQTVNAYHSAEIPFVFDLHGAAPLTPADQAITDHMTGYWLNFAKTASPNGPGLTDWPAYSPDQKTWLIFDKEIHTEENVRKRKLDALESGLQRLMTNAANER